MHQLCAYLHLGVHISQDITVHLGAPVLEDPPLRSLSQSLPQVGVLLEETE